MRTNVTTLAVALCISALQAVVCAGSVAATEPQLQVNFIYNGRTYRLPENQRVLQVVYGPSWRQSFAWRTYEQSRSDLVRPHVQRLQSIQERDVTINLHYDDPNRVFPGEKIFLSDACGWETIQAGESLETMLLRRFFNGRTHSQLNAEERRQLNEAREIVIANNPDRFNVYPHASLNSGTINLPHEVAGRPGLDSFDDNRRLAGLIVHEVAHTSDKTEAPAGSYGGDGLHSIQEITNPPMAFMEGWANYNQALVDPDHGRDLYIATTNLRNEQGSSTARDPRYATLLGAGFDERMACEGVVAGLFLAIDDNGAHRDALHQSFVATNRADRTTVSTLQHYVANASPAEGQRALALLDIQTMFTADDSLFDQFGAAGAAYCQERTALKERYQRCKYHGCSLERFIAGINDPSGSPLDEWDKDIPAGEEPEDPSGAFVITISADHGPEPTESLELLDQEDDE